MHGGGLAARSDGEVAWWVGDVRFSICESVMGWIGPSRPEVERGIRSFYIQFGLLGYFGYPTVRTE